MGSYNYVSVGTAATLIVSDNTKRLSLIIINSGPETVHFAETADVTVNNSPYLKNNGCLTEDSGGTKLYCGPFYGVTSSGTSTVYYWERDRA